MPDVSNNLSPPKISNLFTYQANIHFHKTGSSSRGDYFVESSRLDIQKKSFSRNGVRIWNSVSCEVRRLLKNNFKINIHDLLLQRLSKYDDYIDLSNLITKL